MFALPMPSSPQARSRSSTLLRRVAAWLCLALAVQGFAAALATGTGLLHLHRQGGWVMAHEHDAEPGHAHDPAHLQPHHHDGAERHHHAPQGDLLPLEDADAAGLAAALAAALAALAFGRTDGLARSGRHVWHSRRPWACLGITVPPALRPPAAGARA